jgi:hypothetical protein
LSPNAPYFINPYYWITIGLHKTYQKSQFHLVDPDIHSVNGHRQIDYKTKQLSNDTSAVFNPINGNVP